MHPLAVYIHWPFCKAKCPYCDFNSHVRESVDHARWQKALLSELDYMLEAAPGRTVTSIFFGGGTPSLMPPGIAEALIERVHAKAKVASNIEITLEANPTSVETNTFADFKRAGINRVSLGVQSFNDAELKFLGRGHSAKEARHAIASAADTFERYTFDLIYARPGHTPAAWKEELSEALELARKHLSLYQLTIEENTAFHHAYAKGAFALPDDETSEALYLLTEELCAVRGLHAYEVSNYAAHGEESRHNMSYWRGDDYIGVGPGAHGRINNAPERIATVTIKSPERWLEAAERQGHAVDTWQDVPMQQEIEERVMMGLRLTGGLDYEEFKTRTGCDLRAHLDTKKQAFYTKQGLLENDSTRLAATLKGRLVLTRLTGELLA